MEQIKPIATTNAQTLADFILQNYGPMSHLKLQKLLYYCDAYHLAYFDQPIINEEFEAWVHGPVCRAVYNNLKGASILYSDLGFSGDHNPTAHLEGLLSSDQMQLLYDVLGELSKWSGLQLENATHNEQPWRDARVGYGPADKCEKIISKDLMLRFYKRELNG